MVDKLEQKYGCVEEVMMKHLAEIDRQMSYGFTVVKITRWLRDKDLVQILTNLTKPFEVPECVINLLPI